MCSPWTGLIAFCAGWDCRPSALLAGISTTFLAVSLFSQFVVLAHSKRTFVS
jgi:hypothetical protein